MKDKLRKEMLSIRRAMKKEDVSKLTKLMRKNLESLDEFRKAKTICFYISFENEPETHDMIRDALKAGKKVIIPYVEKKEIILSELKDFSELEKNRIGIFEPKKEFIRKFETKGLDLIIMPGIVFDKNGHRIGFGEGYYDKLLMKTKVMKIALAYEFQIVDYIPAEVHDVPVNKIVTEKQVIAF